MPMTEPIPLYLDSVRVEVNVAEQQVEIVEADGLSETKRPVNEDPRAFTAAVKLLRKLYMED